MSIKKSMTWSEMQELIDERLAFHELSQCDVLGIFGLIEYSCAHYVFKTIITEEPDLITVELITA